MRYAYLLATKRPSTTGVKLCDVLMDEDGYANEEVGSSPFYEAGSGAMGPHWGQV